MFDSTVNLGSICSFLTKYDIFVYFVYHHLQLYGKNNVSLIKNNKNYILFCKATPPPPQILNPHKTSHYSLQPPFSPTPTLRTISPPTAE